MTAIRSAIAMPAIAVREQDGAWHVDAATPLAPYPVRLTDCLVRGAGLHPGRSLAAERGADGTWRHLSYGAALDGARRIGQALRARGLCADRPLVILSGNDLAHFQLALGAMYAGVPYAPLSPAYSLGSNAAAHGDGPVHDYARLRRMVDLLTPGAIFASDGAAYGPAIAAVRPPGCEAITDCGALLATDPGAIDAVHAALDGDTIAKFLFTSGSSGTGGPKAVVTTQRMLCSNQQMLLQTFPVLGVAPPVLVDWLPWSHTFGGSHNVGLVLYNGGTLYIDGGRPAAGSFDTTLANLAQIAPTIHFNVPRGWDMLATALEADAALRARFFTRVAVLFCAGAALAPAVWRRLAALAAGANASVHILSGLGMTETAPGCLFGTGALCDAAYVGLPAPGCRVKLVPVRGKFEACFAGPHVTPGYWRDPARTAAAFDADGYYRTGDALHFADPRRPELGLLFDGRLAEDFKLDSGTWVGAGALRARVVALGAPWVRDAVVAGSGRAEVAVLVFAHAVAHGRAGAEARCAALLAGMNAGAHGSATRVARLLVLDGEPDPATELTDKGSINGAAVLARRAGLVDALYAGQAPGLQLAGPLTA